ncbi:hypothetical protein IKU74_01515 [bacterium]|nr:hypothetical protein [bacterium]
MIIKRKNKQPQISREDVSKKQSEAISPDYGQPSQAETSFVDKDFEIEDDYQTGGEDYSQVQAVDYSQEPQKSDEPEEIDLFNLDNIDFKQRQERRRGDRRRGFRRGDDRNLISRAREEADGIRESASKEGYEAGLEKAQEDILQIKESLKEFLSAPQEVFDYIAPSLLEISVDIAQKIIKTEVTQNPQVVLDKITEILKTLSKEEPKVTVRVNPMQVNIAKEGMPEVMSSAGLDTKIVVLPDESVTEGGCIVTTNNGVIDATIESQLAIVKEALKEI